MTWEGYLGVACGAAMLIAVAAFAVWGFTGGFF